VGFGRKLKLSPYQRAEALTRRDGGSYNVRLLDDLAAVSQSAKIAKGSRCQPGAFSFCKGLLQARKPCKSGIARVPTARRSAALTRAKARRLIRRLAFSTFCTEDVLLSVRDILHNDGCSRKVEEYNCLSHKSFFRIFPKNYRHTLELVSSG
jgi:hypothetical protein